MKCRGSAGVLRIVFLGIAVCLGVRAGCADTIIGWEFEDGRLAYLQQAVELGRRHKINHIQLSSSIVRSVSDLISDSEQIREIRQVALSAKQGDMTVFLWTPELQNLPPSVSIQDPATASIIRERYTRLHTALPAIDGLVLSVDPASLSPGQSASAAPEGAAALTSLLNLMHEVCAGVDWDLWVRLDARTPQELEWMTKGIADSNAAIGVFIPIVIYKWSPNSPYHPSLGTFGQRRQIVEFDLANRNFGRCIIPYSYPNRVREQLEYAKKKGAVGAVARVDCGKDHVVGSACAINLWTFCRFLRDPMTKLEHVWSDYLRETFGRGEEERLRTCFESTREIVERVFLSEGSQFLNDESRIPDLRGAENRLTEDGLSNWDPSFARTERDLLKMSTYTAGKLVKEKDEAVARALEVRAVLERARSGITVSGYIAMSSQMSILDDTARLWRDITYAYCAYRIWKQNEQDKTATDRLRLAHQHLSSWSTYFVTVYGADNPIFSAERLAVFCDKIQPPPPPQQEQPASSTPPGQVPQSPYRPQQR